jgi:hypothetical protein
VLAKEVAVAKQLDSSIDIDARPERVWEVLTDFGAYPEWNPFIVRADGTPAEGRRLTVRMQPVGARGVTLTPTVLEVADGHRLRWLGRFGMPGIFDAEHVFTIDARPGGGTRLRQTEQFRGLLVPFLARSLDRHTLPAFGAMNEALKQRAEHTVAPRRG